MHILNIDKLNELLSTSDQGENIGYGEMGVKFRYVECQSLQDFEENAEFGQCWTNADGQTYYKVKDGFDEPRTVYIEEDGGYNIL